MKNPYKTTISLNPQQQLAVQAPEKPLLIVAGAGTGKTRTLTSRLIYLIKEKGVSPNRIAALTFTNKAAREMEERILSSTNNESISNERIRKFVSDSIFADGKPFIGTFHSFGARILRAEAKKLGRTSDFLIFDDSDSLQLVKKILKTKPLAFARVDQSSSASQLAKKISKIKNGVIDFEAMEESSDPRDRAAIKIFELYEEALCSNNAFDFDDLIEKPVSLFAQYPNIASRYRTRYPYILIDEYQDLDNKQYELVRLLAGDSPRLSVVGDDQQMIFSFRGSNFKIFLDFERDWPDANVVMLEENYRSTSSIIKAASALIAHNQYQKPKNLWTKNEEGNPVAIVEAGDEIEEAEWIADQILSSTTNESIPNKRIRKLEPDSIFADGNKSTAVLYRTNAQSRAIEQALIERSIAYKIFGGVRFYERKEIKDIVAALRLIQNPKDEVSRERLEKNLSKRRLGAFFEAASGAEKNSSPESLINLFLSSSEYFDLLEREFPNADDRRENIAELLHFASSFESLTEFLEQITLLQPADSPSQFSLKGNLGGQAPGTKGGQRLRNLENEQETVHLMTIHLAKGLEFDTVFVAGCSEGLLPHSRSIGSETELEEERRLMYVAMTRARKNLFLSFYDIPSRFLGEIPEEFVAFKSLVSENREFSDADSEERYITLD